MLLAILKNPERFKSEKNMIFLAYDHKHIKSYVRVQNNSNKIYINYPEKRKFLWETCATNFIFVNHRAKLSKKR